jgi:hypothetical protein
MKKIILLTFVLVACFACREQDNAPIILDSRDWECTGKSTFMYYNNIPMGNTSIQQPVYIEQCVNYSKTK